MKIFTLFRLSWLHLQFHFYLCFFAYVSRLALLGLQCDPVLTPYFRVWFKLILTVTEVIVFVANCKVKGVFPVVDLLSWGMCGHLCAHTLHWFVSLWSGMSIVLNADCANMVHNAAGQKWSRTEENPSDHCFTPIVCFFFFFGWTGTKHKFVMVYGMHMEIV